MDNSFIALGLMSGTSLDGIDASIIKSDGENNLDIIDNKYFNYPEEFRKRLSSFILNINNIYMKSIIFFSYLILNLVKLERLLGYLLLEPLLNQALYHLFA